MGESVPHHRLYDPVMHLCIRVRTVVNDVAWRNIRWRTASRSKLKTHKILFVKWSTVSESVFWFVLPVILPLASDGGCQLMLMVRGRPSLLTTVTSLGADVGTEEIKNLYLHHPVARLSLHGTVIIRVII